MASDFAVPPILVVGGLAAEARIASGLYTICVAAPPASLERQLAAVSAPVSAVVSFGICGGIAPKSQSGDLVVPDTIFTDNESFATTRELSAKILILLTKSGLAVTRESIACTVRPVMTTADKTALHRTAGCVAVDTESHLAAAYAKRRGLPFVAIRAVCDPANRDLPPLAVRAIGPDGKLAWRAIGTEIALRPRQLAQLPGTAVAMLKALNSLRRVRRCLGDRLGL